MKTLKILILALAGAAFASAQYVTPNTTLCAAVTTTTGSGSICLTATSGTNPTWSIANQTGIYVDNEYMLVNISNNTVISGTNVYVPVSRSNRSGLGAPTTHAKGAIAWIATTPSTGQIPGVNGFSTGTEHGDVGSCTRASITFLPHIWPDLAAKRDCSGSTTAAEWTNYNATGDPWATGAIQALATTPVTVSPTSGTYAFTDTAIVTVTIAAPIAGVQDGTVLRFISNSAYAHVVTMTGNLYNGGSGAPYNTATLAAYAGASITFVAYGGHWIVIASAGTVSYA